VNDKDIRDQCEEWMELDRSKSEEQKLIDMETVCVSLSVFDAL
jgi:hypothetical protein